MKPIYISKLTSRITCGNLNLLTPYFPLLQWCLNTPYRFVAWAAAQLAYPSIQPHVSCKNKLFAFFTLLWKLAIPILSRLCNELSTQLLNGKNLSCFRPRRANTIITSLRLCLDGRFAACEHCCLQMAALLYTYYSTSFGAVVVGESRNEITVTYIQNSKLFTLQHVFSSYVYHLLLSSW